MRVKLEDVCERGSSNLKQSDVLNKTGEYPIYGASGFICNVNFYHQEKPYVAVVKDGAGIGRTTLHPAKSSVIGTMQYLLPKENVLPEYLCYVVRYMHLEKYFTGATIPHIYYKDYKSEEFNLDTIEKQKEIINILGKLENIIERRKQELLQLDNLIKSRFVEMFGDPNVSFGSDMKKDLYVPKGKETYKVYIQINAIQKNQALGDYYISKEYFDKKISRFEVHPGDYIITCDGTLGKHLKLDENMEKGVISSSLLRLTLDENKMTKEYFEYIWDMYMLVLMKKEARNACLVHLPSAKVIGEVEIPVPPFDLQKQFSTFVHQIDKLKFYIQKGATYNE